MLCLDVMAAFEPLRAGFNPNTAILLIDAAIKLEMRSALIADKYVGRKQCIFFKLFKTEKLYWFKSFQDEISNYNEQK